MTDTAFDVAHVVKANPFENKGGIETVVRNINHYERENGLKSAVLCVGKKSARYSVGSTIVAQGRIAFEISNCPFMISISDFLFFYKTIKSCKILHIHYPWPFSWIFALFLNRSSRIIITVHSDIVRTGAVGYIIKIFNIVQRFILSVFFRNRFDLVFTSHNYLKTTVDFKWAPDSVRKVIPLGIRELSPLMCSKKDFFLFVGRFRHYKGLFELRSCFEKQRDLKLKIISPDFELFSNWFAGLSNVEVLGSVDEKDKQRMISSCIALVLPSTSRAEAFGVVILEAFAQRTPVISTELGTGTSEVNKHMETGIVCRSGDVDELAEALRIIFNNPKLAEALGLCGYARLVRRYLSKHQYVNYEIMYRRALCS